MYLPDDSILVESRAARDSQMAQIPDDDRAQEILSRAKAEALVFATWKGQGIASTEDMAGFYNVPPSTIRSSLGMKEYRDELELDGLKNLRGKALKEVRPIIGLTSETPQALIWTPRAALRLGMFLRDSPVAKQVRTLLIEIAVNAVDQQQSQQQSQRNLELEIELQKWKQKYQDSGLQIVREYSPEMLAFIRGEQPLIRTEIQYVDGKTGNPLGLTTRHRILPQLVEDVGLQRNSDIDQKKVKEILKRKLRMDFDTGEGLGRGFYPHTPLVIPNDRYQECLGVVAIELYGDNWLTGWQHEQQLLPDFLREQGVLPEGDDLE